MDIAGHSILFAAIAAFMVWLLIDRALSNTSYFQPGSLDETKLLVAVKAYLSEFYPLLLCECDGELSLIEERKITRDRFQVVINIACHETCAANHHDIGFIVSTTGDTVDVISPQNSTFLQRYRKNLIDQ